MEKFIDIDGKKVGFKTNGAVPLMYMAQFQKDMIKDILAMGVTERKNKKESKEEQIKWIRENVDFMTFFNIAWVYAKAYDKTIGPPLEWLEGFETFPIMDVIEPLQELLEKTLSTKKK